MPVATINKTFEITATPEVMARFERLLALMHYSALWGHSATFAMAIDGDGADNFTIEPKPSEEIRKQVGLTTGIGGSLEVAMTHGYTSKNTESLKSDWYVDAEGLHKGNKLYRTIDGDKVED